MVLRQHPRVSVSSLPGHRHYVMLLSRVDDPPRGGAPSVRPLGEDAAILDAASMANWHAHLTI